MTYDNLKSKVEKLRRRAQKAQGAKDQLMKQLKEEFDCDTLDEAKELKGKLERQEQKLLDQFHVELTEFEQKYSKLLEEQ
jgi:hypothetical protein